MKPVRGTRTTQTRRNPLDLPPAGLGQRAAKDGAAEADGPSQSRLAGSVRFITCRATILEDFLSSPSCPRLTSGSVARCSPPLGLQCASVWWRARRARLWCTSRLAMPLRACGEAAAPMQHATLPHPPGYAGERHPAARVRAAWTVAAAVVAQATRMPTRAAVQPVVGGRPSCPSRQ